MNTYEFFQTFLTKVADELTPLSLFLFAIPLFLSILMYFRAKRVKKPSFYIRTTKIVEDRVSKLGKAEVSFNGAKVDTLSVSRIAFWNWGAETINGSDIASQERVRICLGNDAKLLDSEIISTNNSANDFRLITTKDGTGLLTSELTFDFIDKNNGAVIQVFHTGTSDDITLEGVIKGAGKIKFVNDFYQSFFPFYKISELTRTQKRWLLGGLLFIAPPFAIVSDTMVGPIEYKHPYWLLVFISVTVAYWALSYMVIRKRLPRGLGIAEEDFIV